MFEWTQWRHPLSHRSSASTFQPLLRILASPLDDTPITHAKADLSGLVGTGVESEVVHPAGVRVSGGTEERRQDDCMSAV